jgi:hypothetical protein
MHSLSGWFLFAGGTHPGQDKWEKGWAILLDYVVVHRTKKHAKVQRLFASLLEDLKNIKE